ncbi:hypothetical protein [Lacticaseibacillus kribbianus]|uniref:hypothetical protein n=1 Tax=Lacticaseibacillus kribbianus TaxID=2926292 RepID=UPI001CD1F2F1|nr:hypothetical protein [Lacticaseibacillus kribbianus]
MRTGTRVVLGLALVALLAGGCAKPAADKHSAAKDVSSQSAGSKASSAKPATKDKSTTDDKKASSASAADTTAALLKAARGPLAQIQQNANGTYKAITVTSPAKGSLRYRMVLNQKLSGVDAASLKVALAKVLTPSLNAAAKVVDKPAVSVVLEQPDGSVLLRAKLSEATQATETQ